jgi:hypothetical protein
MNRLNPMILIALAAVLALLLIVYVFTGGSRGNPERLDDQQAKAPRATNAEQDCGSQATNDLIKRELFRRAAQLRGTDQTAFDRLAASSVVRLESTASRGGGGDGGSLNCSGTVTLQLPPGVSVVGGRQALAGDMDYAVQPSADGAGNVVTLSNADSIITPLAALVPSGEASAGSAAPPPANDRSDEAAPATVPVPPRPRSSPAPRTETATTPRKPPAEIQPRRRTAAAAPPQPAPVPTPTRPVSSPPKQASASPSFNCRYARAASEIAVCRNAELASLDRQMSAQFYSGLSRATPHQRALLQRTRSRFLAARNSCRTNACITNTYNGRMREISDIMNGSWKPN